MANSDIVRRMVRIIDDHEAGRISSSDVEREIENHMKALEKIGLSEIHESRDLTYRLVKSWVCHGNDEFGVEENTASVHEAMRQFFRALPDVQGD